VPSRDPGDEPLRRRGQVLEQAILRAAWDELHDAGWADFQMERVAERAGAGKASIYRRWPNRAALLSATFAQMSQVSDPPLPPNGDLRSKLLAILGDIATVLGGPLGDVARGVVSAVGADSAWAAAARPPVRVIAQVVADAIDDGELSQGAFHPRLLDLGPALVTDHFLFSGRPPDEDDCAELIDLVWLPALRAAGRPA
jgi:AcrR family transcriptional regulator